MRRAGQAEHASTTSVEEMVEQHWRWLLALAWVIVSGYLIATKWSGIHWLSLPDTDDNMRLQQVRDWLNGQGWFDLRQHRMNPPLGADIHWSRLIDLPLAGLILLAKLFVATPLAERFAVAVAPVLPLGVAMAALATVIRRIVSPAAWWLAPAFLVCAPSTLGMMTPLRIDHHGWQLALLSVSLAGLLARRPGLGGAIAGMAAALSLTIGAEMLLFLGVLGAAAAARWINRREEGARLAAYGAAFAGTLCLGFLLFVSPERKLMQFCDALGPPILLAGVAAGGVAVALGLLPLGARWQRLLAALVGGAAVVLLVVTKAPVCLSSPEAAGGPELVKLWLSHVREVRPILRQSTMVVIGAMTPPAIGIAGGLWMLWRFRRDAAVVRLWLPMLTVAIMAAAFVFARTRFSPAAQMLAVPGMAAAFWALLPSVRASRIMPLRVVGTAALFALVSGLASTWTAATLTEMHAPAVVKKKDVAKKQKDKAVGRADSRCPTLPALRSLDTLPPATVMTFLDLGPRLIVITHHSAIAGPYHRNAAAILDLLHAWRGTPDEAHAIAARHGARYVLICPNMSESTIYRAETPNGFYSQLSSGKVPAWLKPVALPAWSPFKLWEIVG